MAVEHLDILVVGGGVTGAGTALDAVTRGLSAGIVEAQDWAAGTSSCSSRLIHGGLRYLEMFDFALVHEALRERGLLISRLAPHLVTPVPFLYPLRHRVWERAYITAGVTLYDLLALSTGNTGGLPHHRQLSRRQALAETPSLKPDALVGALGYYDAHADDARLTMEIVRTAVGYGALAASRARVSGLVLEHGRVVGARVVDGETGAELEIRARSVVLATGPWTEQTEALAGRERPVRVRPAKGIHIVVPGHRIRSSAALIVPTEKSVLFILPWADHWLIGTTDTEWRCGVDRPVANRGDIRYLLDEVNTVLADPLTEEDVVSVFAGLRPLIAGAGEATTKLSREHAIGQPRPGLVVVSGGKYTTYRVMARDAVDAVVSSWQMSVPPSCTEMIPLAGAVGFPALWNRRERLAVEAGLSPEVTEHLLRRHGTAVGAVLDRIRRQPDLQEPLCAEAPYLRAEVVQAVEGEGARHLEDVLRRRLRLSSETRDRGTKSAEDAAALMAGPLGWDSARAATEVERYRELVATEMEAEAQPDDEQASRAMDHLAAAG